MFAPGLSAEVLAPCGSPEAAAAAVRGGADAVYLGYGDFNARRNARNFTLTELEETVAFCHAHGVAVHAALNTLVFPDEMGEAVKTAEEAAEAGVDAFIVQDTGLAALLLKKFPHIPLHASTQLSVHSSEGAKLLYEAGFSRIVLAREMSEREIAEIKQALPQAELEVFVHGALCMSVSGQCWFSALLGGRSGNRGLCAQTCRLPFSCGGRQNALSLKDLSLVDHVEKLIAAGICSLKIEGRMKRPEYVAIASYNVRRAVDGLPPEEEAEELLRGIFSRSGFTDGYFTGSRGGDMFGVRTKEDAHSGQRVKERINTLTRFAYPRLPVDMAFKAAEGEKVALTVTDVKAGNTVTVLGDVPQRANKPSDSGRVKDALMKTGGTSCFPREISVELPGELFVPVSAVNELRREALAALAVKRFEKQKSASLPAPEPVFAEGKADRGDIIYEIRAESIRRLPHNIPAGARVFLPFTAFNEEDAAALVSRGYEVYAELPRLIFGVQAEEKTAEKLCRLKAAGVTGAVCGNVGHVALAKKAGLIPLGGYGLNITNGYASRFYIDKGVREQTLSFETSLSRASRFAHGGTGAIVYGRLPVMLTRNCPLSGEHGCKGCKHALAGGTLTDRMGEEFPVLCRQGFAEVFNSRPLYMGDKQADLLKAGITRFLLYFTDETAEQAASVVETFMSESPFPGKFTRGLYLK